MASPGQETRWIHEADVCGGRAFGDQVGGDGPERGRHLESVTGEADGNDDPVHAGHEPEQAGVVDRVPVGAQHRPDGPGHQRGQVSADPGLHRVQMAGIPGDRTGHRGDLVKVDAGRHLHGPSVAAGEAVELSIARTADEGLLLAAGEQLVVRDREPGQYLGQHRQVGTQRLAHRPGAGSGGHQHPRRPDLFLIRADQPPVTVALQGPDLPVAEERGSAVLGLPESREHRALAAHETALGIEQGHVTVADNVLGQPVARLGPARTSKLRPRSRPARNRAAWSGWS